MGHTQSITQVCTDNTTAAGISNDTIKQQQLRAINMRYFWIRDQKTKQNLIAWKARQENLSDYFTKHHSVKHHQRVRPIYLHTDKTARIVPLVLLWPDLNGCVDT